MFISERIQSLIHATEVGGGARWLRYLLLAVAVFGLVFLYDIRAYRGFVAPEAMDAAQVARNLEEGKGYSTLFIRPFSLYLVQKHNQAMHPDELPGTNDFAQVNGPHPDLANPPVYPTVLAGLMKIRTPDWQVDLNKNFWAEGGRFQRYKPEFFITLFNQFLFLAAILLAFLQAKQLFDSLAAGLVAVLLLGSDLLWKFSISGLSTMLLLVIFLGLVWCLIQIEGLGRNETPNLRLMFICAVVTGLLVGLGMLTRYAFGWVLVPVLFFLTLFGGTRRTGLAVTAGLAFALVVAPWIARNLAVSGTCFGTAGYAFMDNTFFPGSQLMRSINPNLVIATGFMPYLHAFLTNLNFILRDGLWRLGGGWLGVLFFAGLLLGLRNVAARRIRYFAMMCLGVFILAQALGHTQLSNISPEFNSENLLVLLTPLVAIFGVVFFLTLLDQMKTPTRQVRYGVIVVLVILVCQPLISTLMPPVISPVVFPPYNPPELQKVSGWMGADELMMSDIPWAVAWYGRHQCAWITFNSQSEFYQLNDYVKPVKGLYLSRNTLDGRFFSDCLQGGVDNWDNFVLKTIMANQIPPHFPLKTPSYGLSGLFFTDRQRWESE